MQSLRTYFYPKDYELVNHLGNVRAVFSDFKIGLDTDNNGSIDNYSLDVESWGDYYPFGMPISSRTFVAQEYRFGFNAQEKDDEWTGSTGSHLNFKYRVYDTRIARFFAVDPLTPQYPELTPYQFASLNPIWKVEIEGLEGRRYTHKRKRTQRTNSFSGLNWFERNFTNKILSGKYYNNTIRSGSTPSSTPDPNVAENTPPPQVSKPILSVTTEDEVEAGTIPDNSVGMDIPAGENNAPEEADNGTWSHWLNKWTHVYENEDGSIERITTIAPSDDGGTLWLWKEDKEVKFDKDGNLTDHETGDILYKKPDYPPGKSPLKTTI